MCKKKAEREKERIVGNVKKNRRDKGREKREGFYKHRETEREGNQMEEGRGE